MSEFMKLGLSVWQLFQSISLGHRTDKGQDLAESKRKVYATFDKSASLQREEGYALKTMIGLYLFNLFYDKSQSRIPKALLFTGQADTWSAAERLYARCGPPRKVIDALKKALSLDLVDVGWLKIENLITFMRLNQELKGIRFSC